MIKYCLEKWNKNKEKLKAALKRTPGLNDCNYKDIVELVVKYILNEGCEYESEMFDNEHLTVIDDGDYQGTLLFIIPNNTYQPSEHEYLMTYVSYGSCCGCDTLQGIQCYMDDGEITDQQISDFMTLCKDIVTNMIKPYNFGWRYDAEFDTVDY